MVYNFITAQFYQAIGSALETIGLDFWYFPRISPISCFLIVKNILFNNFIKF